MGKFDDAEFHMNEALAHGRTADQSFTHIGMMLSWLARHSLTLAGTFPLAIVEQLRAGDLRPNDLRDLVDGKLTSDLVTPEADRFLLSYYPLYLHDWEEEFSDFPPYGVPDDPSEQARIDRRISDGYAAWLAEGAPARNLPAALPQGGTGVPDDSRTVIAKLVASGHVISSENLQLDHHDLALETTVRDAMGMDVRLESYSGRQWGSALKRTVRKLGLDISDVAVVSVLNTPSGGGLSGEVYRIRGAAADQLSAEFGPYLENRVSGPWASGHLERQAVRTATFQPRGLSRELLLWLARDGYVVYLVGNDELVRKAGGNLVRGLPPR